MVTLQTIVVMILIMSRPQLAEYHNNTFTMGSGIVQTTYKANLEGKDVANNTTVPYIGRSSIETTTEASDQSKQDYLKHIYETVEYVQDIYVLPFVCTIGIIGNGIVAYFLFARRRSSSSFIYMLAIFVTDILSLVSDLFLPFSTLLKESDSLAVREVQLEQSFHNLRIENYFFQYFLRPFCRTIDGNPVSAETEVFTDCQTTPNILIAFTHFWYWIDYPAHDIHKNYRKR